MEHALLNCCRILPKKLHQQENFWRACFPQELWSASNVRRPLAESWGPHWMTSPRDSMLWRERPMRGGADCGRLASRCVTSDLLLRFFRTFSMLLYNFPGQQLSRPFELCNVVAVGHGKNLFKPAANQQRPGHVDGTDGATQGLWQTLGHSIFSFWVAIFEVISFCCCCWCCRSFSRK